MTRVKLGGRELTIPDDRVAEYLEQGYSVIDAKGNTLQTGKILTYEQAITENNKLTAQNKRLKVAYDSLTAENEKLKASLEKANETITQFVDATKASEVKEDTKTKATVKSKPQK